MNQDVFKMICPGEGSFRTLHLAIAAEALSNKSIFDWEEMSIRRIIKLSLTLAQDQFTTRAFHPPPYILCNANTFYATHIHLNAAHSHTRYSSLLVVPASPQ
jgi:hypothetical protein